MPRPTDRSTGLQNRAVEEGVLLWDTQQEKTVVRKPGAWIDTAGAFEDAAARDATAKLAFFFPVLLSNRFSFFSRLFVHYTFTFFICWVSVRG